MLNLKYQIEFGDEARINAIATHNREINVDEVQNLLTGEKIIIPGNYKLLDLKEIIRRISLQDPSVKKIRIIGSSENSTSLKEVFPLIPTSPKAKNYNLKAEQLYQSVYMKAFNNDDFFFGAEALEEFTKEEAITLAQQYSVNAIELTEINTIVFEKNAQCFYLKYGSSPDIGHIPYMNLDIDDGFSFYKDTNNFLRFKDLQQEEHGKISKKKKVIVEKLQEQFVTWKNNNFSGNLFPDTMKIKIPKPELAIVVELLQYREARQADPREYFHPFKAAASLPFWKLKGYTKTQKINAVDKLIEMFENQENQLTQKDIKICKQGGLGRIIKEWEKKENTSLEEYINSFQSNYQL